MGDYIDHLEDVVVGKYERMTGVVPVGFRDMLHILTHPDMLEPLLEYAQAKVKQDLEDASDRATVYEPCPYCGSYRICDCGSRDYRDYNDG